MILIVAGVLLLVLKLLEVGPVAELSWWWTLSPLVLAFVWFEFLEKPLGFDKRKADHLEWEQRRKERVAASFSDSGKAGRRR